MNHLLHITNAKISRFFKMHRLKAFIGIISKFIGSLFENNNNCIDLHYSLFKNAPFLV